jgi:HPt (histidine-containing phosphotransfer) domain-containing protein
MAGNTLPKKFVFNAKIDVEYLFSLYTDDYDYIEEIFSTVLQHFDQDFESVQLAYAGGNLADLKKAIHKIKPTFGFLGLLAIQAQCKQFEDLCQQAADTYEISSRYKEIFNTLADGKSLIEAEQNRLKVFNANPL